LEIYSGYNCGAASYTQTITTTASNLSLGNITVGTSRTATINGNVTDCNSAPVTDGYVILQYGYNNYKTILKPDGTFSLNILTCNTNIEVSIIAINNASLQQSNIKTLALVIGANNAGTLNACGTSIAEFINYTVNGTDYSITSLTGRFYGEVRSPNQNTQPDVYIYGSEDSTGQSGNNFVITFDQSGIGVNSQQNLLSFNTQQINDSVKITAPILVKVTEYGAPGEFIAGNFTGTVTGAPPANTPYNITCNFRVKRSQ
jgi:hypothetical protein